MALNQKTVARRRSRTIALTAMTVALPVLSGCLLFQQEDSFERAADSVDESIIEVDARSSAGSVEPAFIYGDIVEGAAPERVAEELLGFWASAGVASAQLSTPNGSEFMLSGSGGRSDEELIAAVTVALSDGVLIDPTDRVSLSQRRGLEFDLRVQDDADFLERFNEVADLADEEGAERVSVRVTSDGSTVYPVWLQGYVSDREVVSEQFETLDSRLDWNFGASSVFGVILEVPEGGESVSVRISTRDFDGDVEELAEDLHTTLNQAAPTTVTAYVDGEREFELTP